MNVAFRWGDLYIVTFGELVDGTRRGRLVNMETRGVGPLVPVGSIADHCQGSKFETFSGNGKPILEVVQAAIDRGDLVMGET